MEDMARLLRHVPLMAKQPEAMLKPLPAVVVERPEITRALVEAMFVTDRMEVVAKLVVRLIEFRLVLEAEVPLAVLKLRSPSKRDVDEASNGAGKLTEIVVVGLSTPPEISQA